MIHILSSRDQRYLHILISLYQNRTQTLFELAKKSNSSKRNVQIDIKSLNTFINPLFIATNSKEGCVLIIPDDISIDYIYSLILSNSFEYSLLETIFFEKYRRLEDYAEHLYTSVSTLKRSIGKINKRLDNLDIQIKTAPIQLTGNETNICNLMINFFSEKYRFDEIPFSKIQVRVFDQVFMYLNRKKIQANNFSDRQRLKRYFFVLITRIKNGHIAITETDISDDYNLKLLDNPLLKSMFKSVFKIPLNKQTIIQLTQFFIKSNFAVDYQHLLSLMQQNTTDKETVQKLDKFLISISTEFNIPLKNKEQLIFELFNVKQLTIGNSFLLHDTRKEFLEVFISESSYASDIVYSGIEKSTLLLDSFPVMDPSLICYIFITHWEGFSNFLHTLQPVCFVGLFFDSDTEHAQFLSKSLEAKFNGVIHFEVLKAVTLKEAIIESADYSFIVTNISQLPIKNIPCISINMFPNANDIKKITDAYSKIAKFKNQ